jgi:DNA processing protein
MSELLLARAYLSRVGEPGSLRLWRLVHDAGPVEAARRVRAGRLDEKLLAETAARRGSADPEADLAAAQRHDTRLITPESDDWPHFAFAALECAVRERVAALDRAAETGRSFSRRECGEPVPPLALWARGPGELAALGIRSVGLVGSRAATSYGEHVTAELGYGLARYGVAVVSGGAYGIDAAAHRSALAGDGYTVLVSAGGLDRPYPSGNAALFDRVASTGLVLSESPPGCAPQRPRFLTRNRLISALSTGVVVVEAAARSGAMNTATHARVLGRPLMAVPGPVTSPMSAGCHALLRREEDPALLVTCAEEVLAVVGAPGEGITGDPVRPASDTATTSDIRAELDQLEPLARSVFEGLPARRYARPEEVAARSGVAPLDVVRTLPALDLAGLIESADGGYRIAARVRAGTGPRRGP